MDMTFADDVQPDHNGLEQERRRLSLEITNLTSAIAQGGDIPSLSKALKERDKALQALDAQLRQPVVRQDREVLRAALELRTADWRQILRGPHVAQARLVLQHLVDLPIRVMNEPKPKWMAEAKPEGLAVGLVQLMASPPGFARLWTFLLSGQVSLKAA
jgi:hypothetical protein